MSELDNLYQEVVMDHGSNPRNMGPVNGAQKSAHGFNPFCGDLFDIEIRVENDTIADVGFTGKGCAISRASVSLMTEAVKGGTEAEAQELFTAFHSMIMADESIFEFEDELLGDVSALRGVSAYPTRIKCAILGWRTLVAALSGESQGKTISTE